MADIQMNQLATASDANYIYAETADGSQVRIAKADLFSALLQERGSFVDANTVTKPGVYRVDSDCRNIKYTSYGVMLMLISGYCVQVYISDNKIQVRKSANSGRTWEPWRSVSLT